MIPVVSMRWFVATATTLTVVVVLASCERNTGSLVPPAAPTSGSGVVTPLTVRLAGPSTIAPGSSVQLSATAGYSDGSHKDVTTLVTWHSSDTSVLTIDNAGVATGIQSGEATLTAAFSSGASGTLAANLTIIVIPAGTFRLAGHVQWLNRPLDGATVQVTAGIGTGLTAVTSSDGQYRLYGVAGNVALTASKAQYSTIQKTVAISSNASLDFDMVTTNPLPDLAGTYTLQITADPACGTKLSDAARVRRYTATITDETNGLHVQLSDANFIPHANFMFGYVTIDGANLDVNDADYYYGIGYRRPILVKSCLTERCIVRAAASPSQQSERTSPVRSPAQSAFEACRPGTSSPSALRHITA